MEADLRALVSQRVADVSEAGDGIAILFEDGGRLSVRQPFRLCCGQPTDGFTGRRLVALSAGRGQSALEFSGGARLVVRVAEQQEDAPAALSLMTRRGRLAVWPDRSRRAA